MTRKAPKEWLLEEGANPALSIDRLYGVFASNQLGSCGGDVGLEYYVLIVTMRTGWVGLGWVGLSRLWL